MDITMDFAVEHQITQPESDLVVMETCYKESTVEETNMTRSPDEITGSKTRVQSPRRSTSVLEAPVFGTEELPGNSESK